MVQKQKFSRVDDYNPASDFSSSIQETWIHKDIVVKTGDGEDDWIIDQKPVLIDSVDLHKRINEEAKTTDLKYLLKQFLMSGDESILNSRPGFYGDITGVQNLISGGDFVSAAQVKETLPEELKDLTVQQLAAMSDSDIAEYIAKVRAQVEGFKGDSESAPSGKEGE